MAVMVYAGGLMLVLLVGQGGDGSLKWLSLIDMIRWLWLDAGGSVDYVLAAEFIETSHKKGGFKCRFLCYWHLS